VNTVVTLLSQRWWIPVCERLEVPKLEPEGPKAEVGFSTTGPNVNCAEWWIPAKRCRISNVRYRICY